MNQLECEIYMLFQQSLLAHDAVKTSRNMCP